MIKRPKKRILLEKKPIMVDFDGVIHDYKRPIEGRRMGLPITGAKQAIILLRERFKVVIFTVWGGTEKGKKVVSDWMEYYDIPYDEITNIKYASEYYIDDRAIRFKDWKTTLESVV